MKKILLTIIISIFAIFITGCAKPEDQIFDIDKEKGNKKNFIFIEKERTDIDINKLDNYQKGKEYLFYDTCQSIYIQQIYCFQ